MPRFKNHPLISSLTFLALSLVGIWAMGEMFSHFTSKWTLEYAGIFTVMVILLAIMMRWAEKDIKEYRERMRS
ncbi:hypothetical protein [Alicyclobacillus sp. SO9]|uniref:hypothetical protein n=1 Tax=Alicyclobacillus sp. SO9 TaxID=2665646 RepID=UPI0018E88D73|nr:hypothetical protein [Alicyclobacillus sp. SO9]QQE78443.1 hypothetical protein GI364_21635 [Alicyclobacillus sp. SO9]